jgi:hypothetical protein
MNHASLNSILHPFHPKILIKDILVSAATAGVVMWLGRMIVPRNFLDYRVVAHASFIGIVITKTFFVTFNIIQEYYRSYHANIKVKIDQIAKVTLITTTLMVIALNIIALNSIRAQPLSFLIGEIIGLTSSFSIELKSC